MKSSLSVSPPVFRPVPRPVRVRAACPLLWRVIYSRPMPTHVLPAHPTPSPCHLFPSHPIPFLVPPRRTVSPSCLSPHRAYSSDNYEPPQHPPLSDWPAMSGDGQSFRRKLAQLTPDPDQGSRRARPPSGASHVMRVSAAVRSRPGVTPRPAAARSQSRDACLSRTCGPRTWGGVCYWGAEGRTSGPRIGGGSW